MSKTKHKYRLLNTLKIKKLFTSFFILLNVVLVANFSEVSVLSSPSDYEARKMTIQDLMTKAGEESKEVNTELQDTTVMKETLAEEKLRINREIKSVEIMVDTTKMSLEEIDLQIKQNEESIEELNKEMVSVIKEIQRSGTQNYFENFLSSRSIAQAVNYTRGLWELQHELEKVKEELEFENQELQRNKELQEQAQENLESREALLDSKKDSLNHLMEVTQGKEEEYQKYAEELRQQREKLEEERKKIEAEIARVSPDESTTACFFEDVGKLEVTKDDFVKPTRGFVSQTFHCGHDGIDIANSLGTEIVAVTDGEIIKKEYFGTSFGHYLMLKHQTKSGRNFYTIYAHLVKPSFLSVGDKVEKGEVIGYMGSTGLSTGPHLHFMIMSDSFEKTDTQFCLYRTLSSTECYNPNRFIDFN
jgi:murein DD-endopeptidase MepM/ murein hydrolase activator NlpD